MTGFAGTVTGFAGTVTGFAGTVTGFAENVTGFAENVTGFAGNVTGFAGSDTIASRETHGVFRAKWRASPVLYFVAYPHLSQLCICVDVRLYFRREKRALSW